MKAMLKREELARYRTAIDTIYAMWDERSLLEADGKQMDPKLINQAQEQAYAAFHLERQAMYFADQPKVQYPSSAPALPTSTSLANPI